MFSIEKIITNNSTINPISQEIEDTNFKLNYEQSGNQVTFGYEYSQNDTWFYDQTSEDFIYWDWYQDKYDDWEYTNGLTPTLSITHEQVYEIDEDGSQIPVAPPTPPSYNNNWERDSSWVNTDLEVDYTWSPTTYKPDKVPSFSNGWVIKPGSVTNFDDNWNQIEYNHWDWKEETTASNWSPASRVETGSVNKKAWIEWELTSEGNVENKGSESINWSYDTTISPNIDQTKFENELKNQYTKSYNDDDDSFNHQSSKSPKINPPPNPNDSETGDVFGTGSKTINNLSSGWDYNLSVQALYEKPNGQIVIADELNKDFTIERDEPQIEEIISYSGDNSSITYEFNIEDSQSSRISPVRWELIDSKGNIIEKGANNSNYFKKTFTGLNYMETYTFKIDYDWISNSSDPGTYHTIEPVESVQRVNGKSEYKDIKITDFGIDNISSTEMILTMDIDAPENFIPNYLEVGWNVDGEDFPLEKDKIHNGTNTLLVVLPDDSYTKSSITIYPYINGGSLDCDSSSKTYYTTNLQTPFGVQITNIDIDNTEVYFNYETYGSNSDLINSIEYQLDGKDWIQLNNESNEFKIQNLESDTDYSLILKVEGKETPTGDQGIINYSPTYKFHTDGDTSLYLDPDLSYNDTSSASVAVVADNTEYFDNQEITWILQDLDNNKYIQEGTEDILSDGIIYFTIDNLNPDHSYRLFINADIEGNVFEDHIDLNTITGDKANIDNAYITSVDKKKDGEFILSYEGTAKYIEYSLTGKEGSYNKIKFDSIEDNEITIHPEEGSDIYYFRLNGSNNSLFTWYEGNKDTSLYVPWIPNYLTITLVSFFIIILFAFFAAALAFGYHYWLKKYGKNKMRINMWGK